MSSLSLPALSGTAFTSMRCLGSVTVLAALLSFVTAQAEEQSHPLLTIFGTNIIWPIIPVQPPVVTLSSTISVRAAKRLMYEDSLVTPGGGRIPAMFILR